MEYIPFCGTPPGPDGIWLRWTLDPLLLGGLALALGGLIASGRADRRSVCGWTLTALLFVSPLCAASMALFSARVAQHVLLVLLAAPLLAAAWPRTLTPPPALAATVFAALFWLWHLPAPYAATLTSDLTYWAMHLSLLGSATILWAALHAATPRHPIVALLTLAVTAAQMTLLAVLLIVAPRVWHPFHTLPAMEWGIDALADQHLAGAIMWIGGGALVTLAVWGMARAFLSQDDGAAETYRRIAR
jgi:putative membrane protein